MNNKLKSRLFKRSMWTLLAVFFMLILAIFIIVTPIAKQYEMFVDQFFNVTRTVPVEADTYWKQRAALIRRCSIRNGCAHIRAR